MGDKCRQAMSTFETSCMSKKPGRCVRRLTPILKPVFRSANIGDWRKYNKVLIASAMSTAPEARVFDLKGTEESLFEERAAFLSNLFLVEIDGDVSAKTLTVANIGHHAIARLLERELSTPQSVAADVKKILSIARNLAMTFDMTRLDPTPAYAFLVPYGEGALPVVTMKVCTEGEMNPDRRWVMSVRTYLGPDMLKPEDHERMDGMADALRAIATEASSESITGWMEKNARPWVLGTTHPADAGRAHEAQGS